MDVLNESLSHFHQWIVRDIRDRCLELVAQQMAMPAGVLSLRKMAQSGSVADQEAIARMAIHITDMVIELFLYEVDQRITMGEVQVKLRPPNSPSDPVRIDNRVLVYQLYEEWVERYSAVKQPSDLRKLSGDAAVE